MDDKTRALEWLDLFTPGGIDAHPHARTIRDTIEAQAKRIEQMRKALEGVIRVADRKTVEFDAARAALAGSDAQARRWKEE